MTVFTVDSDKLVIFSISLVVVGCKEVTASVDGATTSLEDVGPILLVSVF